MPSRSRRARLKLLMVALSCALLAALAPLAYSYGLRRAESAGRDRSREAWDACYTERGQVPPPRGPRDGLWGSRLPCRPAELGRWVLAANHLPGELDVDGLGRQRVAGAGRRLLVVGGSVASGQYASSEARTWWALLARTTGSDVTVWAASAWRSDQELAVVSRWVGVLRPDLVIAVDGLNDLTELDGRVAEESSAARASSHLANVVAMDRVCRANGVAFLDVLQPSLADREPRSAIEERLLPRASEQAEGLRLGVQAVREGLDRSGVRWLDASRAFEGEEATTFTDLWHFADHGHELLAERIATALR